MPRTKKKSSKGNNQKGFRPALTPEAKENQMISLAVDLAERQLRDGTASSQVITHYLKLGSSKASLEQEILKAQKQLVEAKADNIKSAQRSEELYNKALTAMRLYSGGGPPEENESRENENL
jgi:hypothetical protein